MEQTTKLWVKVLVNVIVGAIVAAAVIALNWERELSWSHRLCDGCLTAGTLLAGVGGLKFIRNQGAFDVMGYSMATAIHGWLPMLRPQNQLGDREEPFEDYRERKQAQRKPAADLLISGGIYMALAVVLLVIYLLTRE